MTWMTSLWNIWRIVAMLHRRKIVTGQWESEAMWSRIHLERKYIIGYSL